MFDPRIVKAVASGELVLIANVYTPTWQHEPHKGWRRILIYKLGWFSLPRRWFKETPRYRLAYIVGTNVICSFENFSLLKKCLPEAPVVRPGDVIRNPIRSSLQSDGTELRTVTPDEAYRRNWERIFGAKP